jgi:hypothetical protein
MVAGGLFAGPLTPAAYALDAPVLLAPDQGIVTTVDNNPPLALPEFHWTQVSGALTYRFQISPDIGFATTAVNITTANNRYTPTSVAALPDGHWYWRVRVETPAPAGDYGETRSFDKLWASSNNAPTLAAPAADATLDFYDSPAFSWQAVIGAATYCLQIATSDLGFSSACTVSGNQVVAKSTLATTYQPIAKLANGSYFWRVVPMDPGGHNGTASEVRPFVAGYNYIPTLLDPPNFDTPTFTPTFRWAAVRGAQYYTLQYSTDPTFNTVSVSLDTRNTTYTPADPLPNDINYYWRVRVRSGSVFGDWSEVRTFIKKWYLQPQLLTPVNNYQFIKDPFFNWTPVPGASHYKIEINSVNSFPPEQNVTGWTDDTTTPFYAQPNQISGIIWCWLCASTWYWRVTPVDAAGNPGLPSSVSSFVYNGTALAPQLIRPLYYYTPSPSLQPHEDRTVALPVFTWHRDVSFTVGSTLLEVPTYQLQVDDDPLFGSPNWTVDTQNLSAVPTAGNPFTPTMGGQYYWRVRPLSGLGGSETNQWSQTWKTRIDTTQGLTPTSSLTLLRPANCLEPQTCNEPFYGFESVEDFPLLEWWPLLGADSYQVQVSDDSNFATVDISATVPYPAFIPVTRVAYGTYYWRVRSLSASVPVGRWSAPWRFQVAAQSRRQSSRTLGTLQNLSPVGTDPASDTADANYELSNLYVAQNQGHWLFGFNVLSATATTTDTRFVLYLDLDHLDGSGATIDARGYDVKTIAAHQPEYAIYLLRHNGAFSAASVELYAWTNGIWGTVQTLDAVGGALTSTANYVEIQVPDTAIGMQDTTGSVALSLFSVPASGGHPQDSVPSDPATPGSGVAPTILSRFVSVSGRLNLAMPPSNGSGDPTVFASIPPFRYQPPVDVDWKGYQFRAALDQGFTTVVWTYSIYATSSSASSLVPPAHTYNQNAKSFAGDNTYYWQVRPIYGPPSGQPAEFGPWSQAGRFDRRGLVPANLSPNDSVISATATFTWTMLEGARYYDIQVDQDPNFGSPDVSATTERNSFTPIGTLAGGFYYWRVRARQYGGSSSSSADVIGGWSSPQTFTQTVPPPMGLTQAPIGVGTRAPTLCWDPLVVSSNSDPVLAAYKYRVQVSKDAAFSAIFDTVDTEQECWTPTKGYDDGTYYWHVAMIDGNSTPRVGSFSPNAQFTKQYVIPQLISPLGGMSAQTPTFVWTAVPGAARYKLEVALSPTFSTLYDSVTSDNTRYTPTKMYADNLIYYWRVAMVDNDGKDGPFTGATVIVNQYPYRVTLPLIKR